MSPTQIAAICARFGLQIVKTRRHGVMLELVVERLDALPSVSALSQIAEALAGDGVRYVALALEEREIKAAAP